MNGIKYRSAEEMKDSGIEWIGQIPRDWRQLKVKYIVNLRNVKSTYENDNKYLGLENIESWTGRTIECEEDPIVDGISNVFFDNDVLFSKLRPYLAKCTIASGRGLCSSEFLVMQADLMVPSLLKYTLLTNSVIQTINASTYGAKMPRASWDFIKELSLCLPVSIEQRKIANFLDIKTAQFDSIIAKKEQLIAKLEEAKKSLISEVVTGKVKIVDGKLVPRQPEEMKDSGSILLDQIPINWNVSRIRHVFQLRNTKCLNKFATLLSVSRHHGVILQSEAEELELATIAPAESMVGYKVVKSGDLVMNIMRAKDGSFGVSGVDGVVSPAYCIYSCQNKQNSSYFYYLFKTQRFINAFENYSTGIAEHRMRLYPENFFEILVCVPILESQNEIVEFLDAKMERYKKHIEKNRQHIEQIKSAKQSLISEAVTGKIDLRDWEIIEQGGAS